jgi:MFS transporter, PAT family, beta-lactamase induction signal transducer AmpG
MNKTLKLLFSDRRMLIVFLLGFVGGLPLLLTGSTLQAWCTEAGMDLSYIGAFALVGTPYTLKFIWAPILDRFVPPFLGRRRGWLLISQLGLILSLIGMAFSHPTQTPWLMFSFTLAVAFMSATQDIGIDAYIIEILEPELYGLGSQLYVLGYRIGMILAGAGSLMLAHKLSWPTVYLIMAAVMLAGIATSLLATEPKVLGTIPRSFNEAVVDPLLDFLSPNGSLQGQALWVFAFFTLYKIGGDMATGLTTPFYLSLGFNKLEIGSIVKGFGVAATIFGGLAGGSGVLFLGLRRSLWIFGIIQAVSYLSFAWLDQYIHFLGNESSAMNLTALAIAISVENFAAGLGTAAYTTFMGSMINRRFTATQFAILSSLMGLPRVFGASITGVLAKQMGWTNFFVFCSLASIPGLLILLKLKPFATQTITTQEVVSRPHLNEVPE